MKGKWFFVRESPTCRSSFEIPVETGPLDSLAGKSVLVLADLENWTAASRQLGCELSLERVGDRLRSVAKECHLFAFTSVDPDFQREPRGCVESKSWRVIGLEEGNGAADEGRPARFNSDSLMLFYAGSLLDRIQCDAVVIGSGDGDLVCTLARLVARSTPCRLNATLSLAGSTSSRVNPSRNRHLTASAIIGLDCLQPKETS